MIVYILLEAGFASNNDFDFVAVYDSIEACRQHRPDISWHSENQGYDDNSKEYNLDPVEVITCPTN